MAVRLIAAVLDTPDLSAAAELVLVVLADHTHTAGGEAWPSVTTIASRASLNRRTVQRHLRDLETAGWVTTVRGGGSGRSNRYRVDPSRLDPDRKGRHTTAHDPRTKGGTVSKKGGTVSQKGRHSAARIVIEPLEPGGGRQAPGSPAPQSVGDLARLAAIVDDPEDRAALLESVNGHGS